VTSRDKLLTATTCTCAVIAAAIVVLVIVFLVRESIPAVRQISPLRFVTDESWHPLSDQFNLVPMILATAVTSLGALLLAGPLGVGSAVFCEFYAPRSIALGYRRVLELLAGIPSVVFGLWGLVVLVPLVATWGGSGQTLLSATLVLGLMILPTVALTTQIALQNVPREIVLGGAALGLKRWSLVWRIVIPTARSGIGAGLLLALARALGETMAVLMLAGNVVKFPNSLLSPGRTLTANIALEMGYATSVHRSILFMSGLFLMLVVVTLIVMTGLLGGRRHVS